MEKTKHRQPPPTRLGPQPTITGGSQYSALSNLPPDSINWDKIVEQSHVQQNTWQCTMCPQTFSNKTYAKKHMKAHAGQLNFSCQECGKKFWQREDLVGHMSQHTNQKQFRCHLCQNDFAYKRSLRYHMKTVHSVDWRDVQLDCV